MRVDFIYEVLLNMRLITIVLVLLVLGGCRNPGEFTGEMTRGGERCKNGVVYYLAGHSIAPAFKPDGTLFLCEKGNTL
jgi:hypothetical protein